ncbi:MAG: PucR family transcriptional regulator ligand-binding domain-containing protein, partial [Microbispora sp.]|nr:PucR family transcriptional regulator ligand-binding domain-containing protein [Microbispora sp.]
MPLCKNVGVLLASEDKPVVRGKSGSPGGSPVAPTLRRITAIVSLHLKVLAGRSGLDRPVRWVAVSELEDPTPFLEGGELVLTTGMRLSDGDAVPYVSRLVGRGVTGLGFGVGLCHD